MGDKFTQLVMELVDNSYIRNFMRSKLNDTSYLKRDQEFIVPSPWLHGYKLDTVTVVTVQMVTSTRMTSLLTPKFKPILIIRGSKHAFVAVRAEKSTTNLLLEKLDFYLNNTT